MNPIGVPVSPGQVHHQWDLFLSYNEADLPWVQALYERLMDVRIGGAAPKVFFAHVALAPGTLVARDLRSALRQSAKVALVMTPDWLRSEWTEFEGSLETYRDPGARQARIIPLLRRDCEIPEEYGRLRWIDFRSDGGFESAFRELVRVLELGKEAELAEGRRSSEREGVLNAAVLPWNPQGSPSFRFLWPERFIDPLVRAHRSPGSPIRFSEWARQHERVTVLAIVGPPGGGKTTLLRTRFLDDARPADGSPFLVTAASAIAQRRHPSEDEVPLVGRSVPELLIDGVDEVGSGALDEVLHLVADARAAGTTTWIACRADFFFRHVALHPEWAGLFDEVVELQEWTRSDAEDFAGRYAQQAGDPELYQRALDAFDRVPTATPLWRNPLQLTLLLYLLHYGVELAQEDLSYAYALYGAVYRHWQHRERHRGTGRTSAQLVQTGHLALAVALDATRGSEPPRLRDVVATVSGDALDAVIEDSAFRGLVDIREDEDGHEVAVGFRHETFAEFVISKAIVEAFERGGSAIDQALSTTYGSHINRFVRSGLDFRSTNPDSHILANLVLRYDELAAELDSADTISANVREQLVYYIGRLPAQESMGFLARVYRNESEPIIRRSAALGAIVHGDRTIEKDYLERLRRDPAEALLNRSTQIVYFLDDRGDFHTYVDNGYVPWRRTRDHIFERLLESSERALRLRWWDLETLLSFFTSRPWDKLASAEADILRDIACGTEGVRADTLRSARDLLLATALPESPTS